MKNPFESAFIEKKERAGIDDTELEKTIKSKMAG